MPRRRCQSVPERPHSPARTLFLLLSSHLVAISKEDEREGEKGNETPTKCAPLQPSKIAVSLSHSLEASQTEMAMIL